jgi:CubicO group peptidase (beta-lactamase class C family)
VRPFLLLGFLALGGCASIPRPPVPPATYAWVTFDRAGVTDTGSAGLTDRARQRRLTIDDPVRIASISKLVVALGVMRMVEQGRLDLDRDVSEHLGWRLRNPHFADRPITLRLLLSHRSSLVDDIDYAIPLGTTLREALADPKAFQAAAPPGEYFLYANLNFPVIASIMEAVSQERFDRLMERLVLDPLGLDACFNWTTCSSEAMARAVVLYDSGGEVLRDDLGGRPPDCPVLAPEGVACELGGYAPGANGALFSPQGGLRISMRDLAIVGRLLLNRGRHGGTAFLSEASMDQLTTPVWRYRHSGGGNGVTDSGFYCGYGLAVQALPSAEETCDDDLLGDRRAMVGHAGDAYGVRSGLWVDPVRGVGIAFFAANLGDDPPRGRSAYRSVEEWLAGRLGTGQSGSR